MSPIFKVKMPSVDELHIAALETREGELTSIGSTALYSPFKKIGTAIYGDNIRFGAISTITIDGDKTSDFFDSGLTRLLQAKTELRDRAFERVNSNAIILFDENGKREFKIEYGKIVDTKDHMLEVSFGVPSFFSHELFTPRKYGNSRSDFEAAINQYVDLLSLTMNSLSQALSVHDFARFKAAEKTAKSNLRRGRAPNYSVDHFAMQLPTDYVLTPKQN